MLDITDARLLFLPARYLRWKEPFFVALLRKGPPPRSFILSPLLYFPFAFPHASGSLDTRTFSFSLSFCSYSLSLSLSLSFSLIILFFTFSIMHIAQHSHLSSSRSPYYVIPSILPYARKARRYPHMRRDREIFVPLTLPLPLSWKTCASFPIKSETHRSLP